jgi:hypothetical protein
MKHLYLILFLLVFVPVSCSNNLSPREFIQWVEDEDNGLRARQDTPHASYVAQYEPALYKAIKTSSTTAPGPGQLRSQQENYADMHHFLLKVRPKKGSNDEISKFLAYQLKDHIQFIRGQDTLNRTVMYHLEGSGGMTPYYRILLAFPKENHSGDLQLLINGNKMDPGRVKFNFSASALTNIPELETENENDRL